MGSQVKVGEEFVPLRHTLAVDPESRAAPIPSQFMGGWKLSDIPKQRLAEVMVNLLAKLKSLPGETMY